MEKRDIVKNHLIGALLASIAEAEGNEELSKRLHFETKLRFMNMSEEELWELAKVARTEGQSLEWVYGGFRKAAENLRTTTVEWLLETTPARKG